MNKEEISKKLDEVSDKLNQTVQSYSRGEIIVEKFIDDLWALHFKLNSLSHENAQIIQADPKLLRITRTLFQEIFKYISSSVQSKEKQSKNKDEEIYF